jgi:hypothetical protein
MLAGSRAFREGRIEEGKRNYLSAVGINAEFAFSYWALGHDLVGAGRPAEAQPYIEKAIVHGYDWRSPGGVTTLIRVYHAVGDTAQASHYAALAARTFPGVLDSTITP